MIKDNIKLTLVLDRVVSQLMLKQPVESICFRRLVCLQWKQIAIGAWHFQFGRYGNLCGIAYFCQLDIEQLTFARKEGPNLLIDLASVTRATNQTLQLVLMHFWCEHGQGRKFIKNLRDKLKSHSESIVYFRIKNGKRIAKILTRDDATTFMRSSKAVPDDEGLAFLQSTAARDFYLPTYNTQMAIGQRVGEMALLMVHAPVAAVSPLKPVLERIQTCAKLEQHKLYPCASNTPTGAVPTGNTPTGLVTWAWLTSKRLRAEAFDTNALQAFEWSEGPHLAVVDMVLSPDTEAAVWADLAGLLYPEEDIWLLCKVGERVFFKKWAKHQRKDLLTNPRARSAVAYGTWHDITQEPACPH